MSYHALLTRNGQLSIYFTQSVAETILNFEIQSLLKAQTLIDYRHLQVAHNMYGKILGVIMSYRLGITNRSNFQGRRIVEIISRQMKTMCTL